MRLPAAPDVGNMIFSLYVPALRYTVSPGPAELSALLIVLNGWEIVPGYVSLPVVDTYTESVAPVGLSLAPAGGVVSEGGGKGGGVTPV